MRAPPRGEGGGGEAYGQPHDHRLRRAQGARGRDHGTPQRRGLAGVPRRAISGGTEAALADYKTADAPSLSPPTWPLAVWTSRVSPTSSTRSPCLFEDYGTGRTGRAGMTGRATSFYTDRDSYIVAQIKRALQELEAGNASHSPRGGGAREGTRGCVRGRRGWRGGGGGGGGERGRAVQAHADWANRAGEPRSGGGGKRPRRARRTTRSGRTKTTTGDDRTGERSERGGRRARRPERPAQAGGAGCMTHTS